MANEPKLEDALRSFAQGEGIEGTANFEVSYTDGTTETIVSPDQAQRAVSPEQIANISVSKGAGAGS